MNNSITEFKTAYLVILVFSLVFLSFLSLMIGMTSFSIHSVWEVILNKSTTFDAQFIIGDVRLPRIIVGSLCGAMFALSGSLLQCVLRNPMAAPDILGVNSASSLFILFFTIFLPNLFNVNILYYAVFGAFTGFIITLLSSFENKRILQTRLIVVGIAIGALFKACCQFIIMQSDEKLSSLVSFLTGTLYPSTWNTVSQITYPALILIPIALLLYKQLDVLLLSDDVSSSIGFHSTKWKIIIILIALLLAGVSVSGSGSLGFIGLIAPNIAKILFGYSHKYNLMGSAIIGATITVFSDMLGRIVFPPYEIPVGLVTIIIGAPYFLYLMKNVSRYT